MIWFRQMILYACVYSVCLLLLLLFFNNKNIYTTSIIMISIIISILIRWTIQ